MKLLSLPRCRVLLIITLLGAQVHGQSSYPMYYQSGPPATMQADSSSTGFEVPIERTGHSFSFNWRTVANGSISSGSAYPKGWVTSSGTGASAVLRSFLVTAYTPSSYVSTPYTYTNNGSTYTSYTYTTVPFSCVEWWLVDTTANQGTPHYSGTPAHSADLRIAPWTNLGTGVTNRYFAIPEARFGHALVAGSVQSAWTPVSSGYYKFGTYSNGTSGTQSAPTFFIGSAPAGAGDFSLADRLDGKKAPLNQMNVIASTWEHDYGIYPMAAATLYLPAAETRYRYVLRWQLPSQPQGATSLMPGTQATALSTTTVNAGMQAIPAGAAKITSTVPIGASFWLTRSIGTIFETPVFTLTSALAAASTPKVWWVAPAAPVVTWSTKTFGIRATSARLAQTFTVSQPSSVSETTPGPAPARPTFRINDFTTTGNDNPFDYFLITAPVNLDETVHLLADGVEVSPTPDGWLYDGWNWVGGNAAPAPPQAPGNYEFSLSFTGPRASHLFTLTAPDGTVSSTVTSLEIFPSVTRVNEWHPDQTWQTGRARWIFPKPYNGPTGAWTFNDAYDSSPQTLNVGNIANYAQNFGYWPPSQRPLALKISASRWTSDGPQRLQLRQADSLTTTQIIPAGDVYWASSQPQTGTVWTNSNYLFNANTTIREGVPYWVYDEDTGEESTPNQFDLTMWFALPRPFPLAGTVDAAGVAHLQWPLHVLASEDGSYTVERKSPGESVWVKLPVPPAPPILPAQVDGSGKINFSESLAALAGPASALPSYRVRYTFGTPWRYSAPSNIVNLDWFNGDAPLLSIVSGDRQLGEPGALLKDALVVSVTMGGTPRQNAPVTFAIASGGGTLSASTTGAGVSALTVTTGADGKASILYRLPLVQSVHATITATPGTVTSAGKTFSGFSDSDLDGMSDVWEDANGFNKVNWRDASTDADGDGISNLDEFKTGANAHDPPDGLHETSLGLEDVIVRNDDPANVTITGTWTRREFYASRLGEVDLVSTAAASVEYRSVLRQGGWYRVYLWHNGGSAFSDQVPVDVFESEPAPSPSSVRVKVNQKAIAGKWDLIGTFRFDKGALAKVIVRSGSVSTTGTGNVTSTSAVRFARVEPAVVLSGIPVAAAVAALPPPPLPGEPATGGLPGQDAGPANEPPIEDASADAPAADAAIIEIPPEEPGADALPPPPPAAALPATSAGVTLSGTWTLLNSPASLNGSFLVDAASDHSAIRSVTFKPVVPVGGDYDVYIWFPLSEGTRAYASEVNVTVTDSKGVVQTKSVKTGTDGVWVGPRNVRTPLLNEGQWIRFPSKNSFRFDKVTPASITITNQYWNGSSDAPVPAGKIVAADSVRLVKVSVAEYVVDNSNVPTADRTSGWIRKTDMAQDAKFGRDFFASQVDGLVHHIHFKPTLALPGPNAPSPGRQDVWLWWPASTSFAAQTRVKVGLESPLFSQQVLGGRWNLMASADFTAALADIDLWNIPSTTLPSVADAVLITRDRDTDNDGLDDKWELQNFPFLESTGNSIDSDGDGVSDRNEFLAGTNPNSSDSDGDGIPDKWELAYPGLFNPTKKNDPNLDSDGDGVSNLTEMYDNTNPTIGDTDGDGLNDGAEKTQGTSAVKSDEDDDGLSDAAELAADTNPHDPDSDDDGVNDGEEVASGTEPNNPQSHPPVWRFIYRKLTYDFADYPKQGNPGDPDTRLRHLSSSASWTEPESEIEATLTAAIPFPSLSSRLARDQPFPATKPSKTESLDAADGKANLDQSPPGPCFHATLKHARLWLEVKPAPTAAITRRVPRFTERTNNQVATSSNPDVVTVEVTIPAGQTTSAPVDLTPSFVTSPTVGTIPVGGGKIEETVKQSLLPIEISSADRLLTGLVPTTFDEIGLEFATKSGQVLGHYENLRAAMAPTDGDGASSGGDGTNYHIYGSRDEIFDSTEGKQIESGNIDSKRFSTRVVLYKEGSDHLRFMSVFDDLGDIEIRILKGATKVATIDYTLESDEKTYQTIVTIARTVAQVKHLPQFENLQAANDPYEDSGDDEDVPTTSTAPPYQPSLTAPSAGTEVLPSKPFNEVPAGIRDRVGNIVAKLIGPMEIALATPAGKNWLSQKRQQWNLRMLFLNGFSEGFSIAIDGEVNNVVSTVKFTQEVARLVTSPVAAYYRGRQLYRALSRLDQEISNEGGVKNYVKKIVDKVKEDVELAFDWLNTGYISDENDAYILGYGAGYGTETIALFVALNLATDGEAVMAKAVSLVREGGQAIQFLSNAGKFKIRMLMWSLNYGRYFQVTLGVANIDAARVLQEVRECAKMLNGFTKASSAYSTSGGSLEVLAIRYKRIDELAKQLARTNRKGDGYGDWLRSQHALKELSTFSEAMGTNVADALSEPAMRGYAQLAQSMCVRETVNGVDQVHTTGIRSFRNYLAAEHDYTILPPIGSLNRTEANAILALFDQGVPFALEADGHTWIYKNLLRYGPIVKNGRLADEQHRIAHVLHHAIDHPGRAVPHGVFTVPKDQIFELLHQVRTIGARNPPGGKDFEHTFVDFVGKANNTPGTTNGLPLIPYQQTKKGRLGLKFGTDDVNTGFPKQ